MAEELEENVEPEWRMNPNGPEPMDSILYMRSIKYPDVREQLDMLWHAINNDSLNKTCEFYTTLKAIKDNAPKPE